MRPNKRGGVDGDAVVERLYERWNEYIMFVNDFKLEVIEELTEYYNISFETDYLEEKYDLDLGTTLFHLKVLY